MKKNIKKRCVSAVLAIILVLSCLAMSSCMFFGTSDSYMTEEQVKQMMNNTMSGNVTVQGGDNYNITIDGVPQDNAAAGKSLLSAVSIKCVFKTVSYGGFYPSGKEKTAAGSGVIYKLDKERGNAYIITNYHVVYYSQSATENGISNNISVYLYGQEHDNYAIPATYVGGSMEYDIAILKVSGSRVIAESNAVAATFADSEQVSVLDQAIAVGNPEALGISATFGYVNVDSEYIDMEGADGVTPISIRVMRIDTAVNSGNSGGGLFNNEGEIIGIVNAKLASSENMSYAIPSNFVKYVAENILYYCDGKDNESVMRCYLGISVGASKLYTVYDTETGKVHKRETVVVAEVSSTGIANGVLKPGDLIHSITIDGVTYEALRTYVVIEAMLNARVGSAVSLKITRDGSIIDVPIAVTQSAVTAIK